MAAGPKVSGVQIAQTYFVGKPRQALDPPGDEPIQHEVEHDDGEDENRPQRHHENLEYIVGTLKRDGGRYRYDLRADYIVYLPAEAIDGTVGVDHRPGRGIGRAVADNARRILDLDRPRQIQRASFGRVSLSVSLEPGRYLPESVDHIDLPIGGAVAWIGRIERRILLAHVVELLGSGERRNRLRQKAVFELRLQQRLHLIVGIRARGRSGFHHDSGVLQNFLSRIALQHLVRDETRHREAENKDREKRGVEFPD